MEKERCSACNKVADNYTETDSGIYCYSCFDEWFFVCDDCRNTCSVDDSHTCEGNSMVCGSCFDDYGCCYFCGDYSHCDSVSYVNDESVCSYCYSNECGYCDECDTDFFINDGCNCEEGDGVSLREIQREFTRPGVNDDTLGVEIEAEGGSYLLLDERLPKSCGIHYDGSLRNKGVEVVTPPLTPKLLDDYIKQVCEALNGAEFTATDNCGVHVHLKPNVSGLKLYNREGDLLAKERRFFEVVKMIALIMEVGEDVFYNFLPVSRKRGGELRTSWSRPLTERGDNLLIKLKQNGKVNKLSTFYRFINSRYYGLNFQSLPKYKTIEYRYFSGSTQYEKIRHYINIIEAISNKAKDILNLKYFNDSYHRREYNTKLRQLHYIHIIPSRMKKAEMFMDWLGIDDYETKNFVKRRTKKFYKEHLAVTR